MPLANWVNLIELESYGRAVVSGCASDRMAKSLGRHFGQVEDRSVGESDRGARSLEGPSADCFVIDLRSVPEGRQEAIRDSIAEGYRELVPGGWMILLAENPLAHSRLRGGGLLVALIARIRFSMTWKRVLGTYGFKDTRAYYLSPSHEEPMTIVPARRAPLIAMEPAGWRKRMVGWDFHRLLYRDLLVAVQK